MEGTNAVQELSGWAPSEDDGEELRPGNQRLVLYDSGDLVRDKFHPCADCNSNVAAIHLDLENEEDNVLLTHVRDN